MSNNQVRLVALGTVVVLAGCGGSGNSKPVLPPSGTSTDVASPSASLDAAARLALRQNYALSLYTLWHDRVPATAIESTRGPALAGLRASAEARRKRGVHIRVLDRHWRIVSLRIDPSYIQASAIVQSRQHVRTYDGDSRPLGKAILLTERARIELHRLGATTHYVVWNVAVIK